jgi:hypothetical protein
MTAPRITLDLHQHNETHGDNSAWLLSRDKDDVIGAKWIAKSLGKKLADGRFEIDAWKARQAGFLIPRGVGQGRFDL